MHRRFAIIGGRQVVVTRAFVAKCTVNNDEIRWHLYRENLSGRGHAQEKSAARCEQLLGNEDRKRGSDDAAQDSKVMPAVMKDIEIGMVASPTGVADGQSSVA